MAISRHLQSYNRKIATLVAGTAIAQAIPVAIMPVLTRIYSPSEFGVLAMFISLSLIIGSAINARYELAIMLPEDHDDAINLAALCLFICTFISLVLYVPIVFFEKQLLTWLENDGIKSWIYIVPASVWLLGFFNILTNLNNRLMLYNDIAKAQVYKSLTLAFVQVFVGIVKAGGSGLILGHLASQFASNVKLSKNIRANYDFKSISINRQLKLGKAYKKFPLFSLWAGLANTSSYHLVSLLIPKFFSLSTLGFYFLVERMLGMPTSLIGSAIGQVFYQEATVEKNEKGHAISAFKRALGKLFIVGVGIFLVLYLLVEDLFILVFGPEWAQAGLYAKILTPLFFVRFVISPLTLLNLVFERNEIDLIWQVVLVILQVTLIIVAAHFAWTFEFYLYCMVSVISTHYLIMLVIVTRYNHA